MGILNILNDKKFNIIFSFLVGIGLVCIIRPMCSGDDCNVTKAPADKDFEKYAYRMGGNKCYEFKTEIIECPASGTIEAFRECSSKNTSEPFRDQFSRRESPIQRCE